MANIVTKHLGTVVDKYSQAQAIAGDVLQSPLNKLWRAKILINRAKSPMLKDSSNDSSKKADVFNKHYAIKDSVSQAQVNPQWEVEQVNMVVAASQERNTKGRGIESINKYKRDYPVEAGKNLVGTTGRSIVESSVSKLNNIIIINSNVSPAIYVTLQNKPSEVHIDSNTSWSTVKSIGRNNPYQIYNGSEETVSFEVSWFCNSPTSRMDVITKCRLLETWSKSDGYNASPPTLDILWGNSEGDHLFKGYSFILTSASYRLSNFQNVTRNYSYSPNTFARNLQGEGLDESPQKGYIDLGLLPNVAVQTLVFKRVASHNLTHEDMMGANPISGIPGINQK